MDYKIKDESGDKKYFTIIPNYIVNHSTANDQALYLQMKRFAGEKGVCFASEKLLRKQLGIGRLALKNSLKYLIEHGWIKFVGVKSVSTQGGKQDIKVYEVSDIWQMNQDYYKGVAKTAPLKGKGVSETAQRGVQNDIQGVLQTAPKKNTEKNINKEDTFLNLKNREAIEKIRTHLKEKTRFKGNVPPNL